MTNGSNGAKELNLFAMQSYLGNCFCSMFSLSIFAASCHLSSALTVRVCLLLTEILFIKINDELYVHTHWATKTIIKTFIFSLLSEPKVVSGAGLQVTGEQKVVMASRAGRLLRSVKLLLAREKSYDVSTAEGRKRGRRLTKSVSTTR